MAIAIHKVSDNLYTASLTLPDVPGVTDEWSTAEPLGRDVLVRELRSRGCHPVDIWDALYEADPSLLQNIRSQADPAVYIKLREKALQFRLNNVDDDRIQIVLMEWHVGNGVATVTAVADGSASLYLSNGGGFIGGGEKYAPIRIAAFNAIDVAGKFRFLFKPAERTDPPPHDEVYFYLGSKSGLQLAVGSNPEIVAGHDALSPLAAAMQRIITEYRRVSGRTV